MKTIIVTPAGRERYLKILYKHLLVQKKEFFQWHLWLNTTDKNDIEYCKKLEEQNDWIKTFDLTENFNGNLSICNFFKHSTDSDTIYIRFDDDIVYLEPNFIKKFTEERIKNKKPFFIFPLIINNGNIGHHLQKNNKVWFPINLTYAMDCLNELWRDASLGEKMHRDFIIDIKNNLTSKYYIKDIIIDEYHRHSINCISWFGETVKEIVEKNEQSVYKDEEQFISVIYPQTTENPNVIVGNVICSHFAFQTQRDHMDKTNLLLEYDEICTKNYNDYVVDNFKQDILKESKNSIHESNLLELIENFKNMILLNS